MSFLRKDNEDKLLVQPIFYFRVYTHSVETNYAPQLPERRCPAACNNQPCQEVLKYSGEALSKWDL